MASPFIGEIKMFGGNFAIANWAFCDGSVQSIAQNTALFSLLGTMYGGDGQVTFRLPDLRSRIPIGQGTGPGLTTRTIGEASGTETVPLFSTQIPAHTHTAACNTGAGNSTSPANNFWAANANTAVPQYAATPNATMNPGAVASAGGNQPHNNMMPYLAVNFIISLYGIFPQRN
jgi:prepilin-type processing-associated H-X9-DG protein